MSADSPVALTPPDHRPRKRIVIAATALTCFAAGAVAAVWGIDTPTHVQVETFAQPVNVAMPALPPITVVVAPTPAPPVSLPSAPPIRATKPFLDPACISIQRGPTKVGTSCDWSDGFPAVSLDGTMVVTKEEPEDGGRGNPALTVRFIDVKTSTTVREIVLVDPDEVDPTYDGSTDDAAYATVLAAHQTKLNAKVLRRVHKAQKLIDATGYRSMVSVGTHDETDDATERPTSVYAQVAKHENEKTATVRAIDPATNTSLWTHTFGAPRTATRRSLEPGDDCNGFALATIEFAWDPQTRIVLASSIWNFGGCTCGSTLLREVVKL